MTNDYRSCEVAILILEQLKRWRFGKLSSTHPFHISYYFINVWAADGSRNETIYAGGILGFSLSLDGWFWHSKIGRLSVRSF
jgi:hypothetical protein